MILIDKIIALSKKIATSILKDESSKELEDSSIFSEEDKDYIINNLKNKFDIIDRKKFIDAIDTEEGWKKVKSSIRPSIKRRSYWKYSTAASVALLVTVSLIYNNYTEKYISNIIVGEIKGGTDKAILTLENGTQIVLEKGKIFQNGIIKSNGEDIIYKYENSSNPSSDTKIAYNYLTIPRGGKFFIQLPDSTKVWLNSDSKLKYPIEFIEGQPREVELVYGEAYFDVNSSKNHQGSAFKVFTHEQAIEVLGTEFNIKAYSEIIYTTLVEGKVAVQVAGFKRFLKPNQQSVYNLKKKSLSISENVKVFSEVAWQKGILSFDDKSLNEIMEVLSRWYNVEIIFENEQTKNIHFTAMLDRSKNINEILDVLEKTNEVKFSITKNTIIIK